MKDLEKFKEHSLRPFDVLLFDGKHIGVITEVDWNTNQPSVYISYSITWMGSSGGKSAWWDHGELIEAKAVFKGNILLMIAEGVTHPFGGAEPKVRHQLNFGEFLYNPLLHKNPK